MPFFDGDRFLRTNVRNDQPRCRFRIPVYFTAMRAITLTLCLVFVFQAHVVPLSAVESGGDTCVATLFDLNKFNLLLRSMLAGSETSWMFWTY